MNRKASQNKSKKSKADKPPREKPKGVKKDEPGGEVITVEIRVNNTIVYRKSSVITTKNQQGARYKGSDGNIIRHRRNLGPLALARRMIE